MEQQWFPGVHCNIDGGYVARGLSDLALDLIIKKAQTVGQKFETEK